MKKNVSVNVTGVHHRQGEEPEKIITTSRGLMEVKDDGIRVVDYVESQETDGESIKVHNKLLIASDERSMDLVRGGDNKSRLSFGEKMECNTEYNTPYGSLQMKVKTSSFEYKKSDDEDLIEISADYILELDGQALSESQIMIEIKEAKTY
ncbi:DUF1934 domain-containing protein [Butyrivibrio proteoclasticus]|uniref:DUF1934 domain-containing protein n=1 Tax=Butyrivibrio proteoclasticus TaxID=43305 RepID=UPI00047ECA2A|nr:DUF1934 domain-containing protein [Butyrivibrio proteoclasticus]